MHSAGGRRDDAWIKIIQWLTERDALHIVVVIEKFYSNARISSQINNLLNNKKVTISFKSLHKLNSLENAARLIDETNKLALLDSVFFVSMVSALKNRRHIYQSAASSDNQWKIPTRDYECTVFYITCKIFTNLKT